MDVLERLIDQLAADPMYQLSTAGQELFHTNMLFWLATQRPAHSAPVWELLDVDPPLIESPDGPGPIRREWLNIDLYVDSGMPGRKLVLENKVLAVATSAQLNGYRDKLLAADSLVSHSDPVTSWRILTLLPLTFDPPAPWRALTYTQLTAPLEQTAEALDADPAGGDDAALVRSYARLVHKLVALTDAVDIATRLHEPYRLPEPLLRRLQGARLSALVQKMRAARCATLLTDQLQRQHPAAALPHVKADLTRGEALLEAFVLGRDGRQFGWQVQGTQVRLAMLTSADHDEPSVSGRDAAAQRFADYFDFDDLPTEFGNLLGIYGGKRDWLGYGHEFVYRYRPLLPEVNSEQLIEFTAHLTTRAISYSASH